MIEDALGESLRLAATEPAHRPEFYQVLLAATVYILGTSEQADMKPAPLERDTKFQIRNWQKSDGSSIIPFFSSLAALQRAIAEKTNYVGIPAKVLFNITRGASLVLNPKSDHVKEFTPNEIEMLLTEGVGRLPQQRNYAQTTNILISQPKDYPAALINSLTLLFAKSPNVKSAYLVQMHDASADERPNLVIGIDADGNFEDLVRAASVVTSAILKPDEYVDFLQIKASDVGLSTYMIEKVKPFYQKSWGSKLKSFFVTGKA